MKAFVTGATGFIGGRLVELLRERGDDVVALVRDHARAARLAESGCRIVNGDLSDVAAMTAAIGECDSVFHLAGHFEIGIPPAKRDAMWRANVDGTRNVLEATATAGPKRVVYASTVNVFGDTKGAVVDETFRRHGDHGFRSWYDKSKYHAHLVAEEHMRAGMNLVTVMPGVVYGPDDHFEIGRQIVLAGRGKLPVLMLTGIGVDMGYVDDIAEGFVLAHDRGNAGEAYVLGGAQTRLRDVLRRAAYLAGARQPRLEVPIGAIKAVAPLGPVLSRLFGYPPNLREVISVADGTTYWATHEKARRELGYAPRSLDDGLRLTLEAAGIQTVR